MTEPIRVLHVIDRLSGGGAEASLATFLERATLDPRASHLAAALVTESPAGVGVGDGPSSVVSLGRPPSLSIGDARTLRGVVDRFDPHVVHSSLFRSNLAASLARGKRAHLITLTSSQYAVQAPGLRLRQRVGLRASQRAHTWVLHRPRVHVHAVSRAVSSAGQTMFALNQNDISIIPRGRSDVIQLRCVRRDEIRRHLGLDSDAVVVGMVAREHHVKNHVGFLETIAAARAECPQLRAILVGAHGNASAEIGQALSRLQLHDAVLRLGHRNDVPDLLGGFDIFACTSRSEGLPGGVIEALAASLPVVAYDVPGVDEAVGHHHPGLVTFGDKEAFAQNVASLYYDAAQRAHWGDLARARYEAEFTLDTYVRRMTELYLRLANQSADACSQ